MSDFDRLLSCYSEKVGAPALTPEMLREFAPIFHVLVAPWLNDFEHRMGRKPVLLDLGCSLARLAHFSASHVERYIGIDLREGYVKGARAALVSKTNCVVYKNDGLTFKEHRDGELDLIFAYQTFIHVPDSKVIESYVKEIARVLSEDGEARLQLLGSGLKRGFGLSWASLRQIASRESSSALKSMISWFARALLAARVLPGDFMAPVPRYYRNSHAVGQFGVTLHPQAAIALAVRAGLKAWIRPAFYHSTRSSSETSMYWLVLRKRDEPGAWFQLQ